MPAQQWRYTATWSETHQMRVVTKVFTFNERGSYSGVVEADDFLHASRLALTDAQAKFPDAEIHTITVHLVDDKPSAATQATDNDLQLVLFPVE